MVGDYMKEKLNTVCDIAEEMLKCGAEVHRVEETLLRMCYAIGGERADVFIITSSIVVTVYTDSERAYTQTRRINSIGTDLERLHRLNDLARRICGGKTELSAMREEFLNIKAQKQYPAWLQLVVYGLIGGAFAVFFGGSFKEGGFAFLVGIILFIITYLLEKASLGKIFCRFAGSFAASTLAYALVKIGLVPTADNIIIGNIMVLIPGIGLTNALRDLFVGDSIAGLLRIVEAVLIALAIAAGHFLFLTLFRGVLL